MPVLSQNQKRVANRVATVTFLALSVSVFVLYSPLAYGNQWTKSECKRVKVLGTWDFDCNTFFDTVSAPAAVPELKMPKRG
jgi:dolichyl-phosphate-mannose-protein mannosyltransferase